MEEEDSENIEEEKRKIKDLGLEKLSKDGFSRLFSEGKKERQHKKKKTEFKGF
ncbi:MAG: hypothetical protein ACTSWY_00880 [Promethearchaeota archaeon]